MSFGTTPTVIIGGGLAGMSAALHSTRPYRLFEQAGELGGLARTEERDGYFFDRTGHWLHLRDPQMKELAVRLLGSELVEVQRKARCYLNGALTRYPFQANLYGLPAEIVSECLQGFVQARLQQPAPPIHNFEDYVMHHFGAGIAKHFMIPYNAKLWGVSPREITSAWCSRFVPTPSVAQVIDGAVGAGPPELGYNIKFMYPKFGGIQRFSQALAAELNADNVSLRATVEKIDYRQRCVAVGGQSVKYHALISTMPLTQLVASLIDPPQAVVDAASRLRATAVNYLNVAVKRTPPADYHWVYVPEDRLPFYRVGVFSNAMPSMAPPGCASLYVELSRRGTTAELQAMVPEVLAALVEVQAIHQVSDVVFADLRQIAPAYVIFDENYQPALDVILPFLTANRIFSCGRYGSWIYNAMEDSLIAGRQAAADALALTD